MLKIRRPRSVRVGDQPFALSWLPLVAILLLSACPSVLPNTANIVFACDQDRDCTGDGVCRANICVSADAGHLDAGQRDAAVPDLAGRDLIGVDLARPDAAGLDLAPLDAGPWWDDTWHRRRRLTFDNGDRETLVDFPVAIKLDPSRIDYAQVTGDGNDVRFVDADGATVLDYQLERWYDASTSWLWVKVPRIEAASTTDFIWMYYGNPSAPIQSGGVRVWSAGYEAVYPLSYGWDDMSGHGISGTEFHTSDHVGQIAHGRIFDGTDAWIDLGRNRRLLRATPFATLSAWINPNRSAPAQMVVAISVNAARAPTAAARAFLAQNGTDVAVGGRATDDETERQVITGSHPIVLGEWYHVVGTIDYGAKLGAIYINGIRAIEAPLAVNGSTTADTLASNGAIGVQADGNALFFGGIIDDVRISTVARTADWISAEYQNQGLDSFVTFGPEEQH